MGKLLDRSLVRISIVLLMLVAVSFPGCGRSSNQPVTAVVEHAVADYQIPLPATADATSRVPDSIGIIFCLDVSGSMESSIDGRPKIEISKTAMRTVFDQIETYVQRNPNKKVQVGLISFSGGARLELAPALFDKQRLERQTNALQSGGGTAIGDAMVLALQELHKSGVESRAIIVMTDGENNRGHAPEQVMQAIRANQNSLQTPTEDVSVFLVAFDVTSSVFQEVAQAGASVVESRDANSLQEMLNTVVEEVLLEKQ
jgi:Mg-chelatase subunit ChlD